MAVAAAARARQICASSQGPPVPIVSLPHAIAYFPVPKAACTTGKELMHRLVHGEFFGRRPDPASPSGFTTIHGSWHTNDLAEGDFDRTAGMWRFAILRDPVARLLSCWKNKVWQQRALSEAEAGPALAAAGLPPDPSFAAFVEALEGYRGASAHVAHHCDPHTRFLGREPARFDALYRMEELPRLCAALAARTGQALSLPPVRNRTSHLPDPPLDAALRRRIEAFYAEDLEVFGPWLVRRDA